MDNIVAKQTEQSNYQYDYDGLYRVTEVDNPDLNDEAFIYDAVGNRLTLSATTSDRIYNENNKYYLFHNNHLGTPQKIIAGSGAMV
jgi:YD repeat-containing protein